MRAIPFLTALLSPLQPRDYGQYTIWTSTPTTYISYYSTEMITVTEWVPCPVLTSYTTTTMCSNCPCVDCGQDEVTCAQKYCTYYDGGATVTPYSPGEQAPVLVGGSHAGFYTPYEHCSQLVDDPGLVLASCQLCGGIITSDYTSNVVTDNNQITTVTYTYTTDGATIVVATTIAVVGGPFSYGASGAGNKIDGHGAQMLFWLWLVAAAVAGTGMVIL